MKTFLRLLPFIILFVIEALITPIAFFVNEYSYHKFILWLGVWQGLFGIAAFYVHVIISTIRILYKDSPRKFLIVIAALFPPIGLFYFIRLLMNYHLWPLVWLFVLSLGIAVGFGGYYAPNVSSKREWKENKEYRERERERRMQMRRDSIEVGLLVPYGDTYVEPHVLYGEDY